MTPTLSVVVVARNEAERIGGCIESVLSLGETPPDEVILVDSNSSDRTVEIASDYPITILRIPSDDLSSPGAGRHVGFQRAHGDLVLFVDGDMQLEGGWLDTAMSVLAENPDVAGVDGLLRGEEAEGNEEQRAVENLRGVALYDATAMDAVGGFDPGLHALEDVDVGFRLRRAGHELVRLPVVVASHPPSTSAGERLRRWNEGYYLSNGQVLRKSIDEPRTLARWLYRFRFQLAVGAWGVLGLTAFALRKRHVALAWTGTSAVGFLALAATRGLRWTVLKLSLRLVLFFLGMAVGFRRGPTHRAYPVERVEVVTSRTPGHD